MVRTDVIINWTIQRSFPWAWVALFTEQIEVPCVIFLSDKDTLVPATKVEDYLKSKDIPIKDFDSCEEGFFLDSGTEVQSVDAEVSVTNQNGYNYEPPAVSGKKTKEGDVSAKAKLQRISCVVFRGDGHGDWTERPSSTIPVIVEAAKALCRRVEAGPRR